MKNLNFLLALAFMIPSLCSFGQDPGNFVDSTNKWFESGVGQSGYAYYDSNNVLHSVETRVYIHKTFFYNRDTIVNNILYKKMYYNQIDTTVTTDYYSGFSTNLSTTYRDETYYHNAFRQDNKKVYIQNSYPTFAEKLYVDFDLNIGDTIYNFYSTNFSLIVGIDSIAFNNSYRKKYVLNSFSIIEGVGPSLGVYNYLSYPFHGGPILVCFEQAGIKQYVYDFWGTGPPCPFSGLPLSTRTKSVYNSSVRLYPNPFSDKATIEIGKSTYDKLSISSMDGRIVMEKNVSGLLMINISRENLMAGVYFYRLNNSKTGNGHSGKFIIQD